MDGIKETMKKEPIAIPKRPPIDEKNMTFFSINILDFKITSVAAVIPTLCIAREKLRAIAEEVSKMSVKAGNATAPPPSAVAPAMKDPKTIIAETGQYLEKREKFEVIYIQTAQTSQVKPIIKRWNFLSFMLNSKN